MAKRRARISANIARLFYERDLPDRIEAAADAGFNGVELPLPYDHPAPDLRDRAVFAGVRFVRLDAPPPNYTGGPQGYAAVAGVEDRFQRDFKRALRQSSVLGTTRIHLRTGKGEDTQAGVLVDNLRWAAEEAPKAVVLIEALNPRDHPDHCLSTLDDTLGVLTEAGAPNAKLLFSTYHMMQDDDADLSRAWEKCADLAGHVLLGGGKAPKEIDHYAGDMIKLMRDSEYDGWACADFDPSGPTAKSLGWLPR